MTSNACCPPRNEARRFCQPAVWVRIEPSTAGSDVALYSDMGRAFARFSGWRAACFVANPNFLGAFAHAPIMTKPASNADLRGAFLVFQL
jgi:hypothetical protein